MGTITNTENNFQITDTILFPSANLYSYGNKLKIPYFASNFHFNKTLDDSFEKLESTPGPLLIKNGKIMPNNNVKFKKQPSCFILIWPSDEKSEISYGQGIYYGQNLIMTAKHVLGNNYLKKFKIYVLFFPTFESSKMHNFEYCLIYKCYNTLPPFPNRYFVNQDIALIKLQGCSDTLENIKLGKLHKDDYVYFNILESGQFVRKRSEIKNPNSDMKKQMSANEFVISIAGKDGDSGTPILSKNGMCVGIYIGAFKAKNSLKPLEYGRALQFDRNFIENGITKNPNSDMKKHMSANEFAIPIAGKDGDSGTPIFSSKTDTCVEIYIGDFETKNSLKPLEYGRALQFVTNFIENNPMTSFFSVSELFKLILYYFNFKV
ncbi:uncharacterized protein LOC120460429 [Pimephales promelas]|uniref:uncharacterized protein LOC120460429 n=1 Tax=Pimephales promelas TaxID=90988 RepID=UPI0019557B7E|nr:uncharacterized protein LOC120460429 [Pimephales promelas]